MKALLFFLMILPLSGQMTWRSDSFLVKGQSNDPMENPSGPPLYPTVIGAAPAQVAYANGVWYFVAGNYFEPRVFDHDFNTDGRFMERDASERSYLFSQPGGLGAEGEWVMALAAGDDKVLGVSRLNAVKEQTDWKEFFWDSNSSIGGAGVVHALLDDPWRELWIAVGSEVNTRSQSGGSWVERVDAISGGTCSAIAAGPEAIVVVRTDGKFLRSENGVTWTAGTINASVRFEGVAWGDGQFVAVGDDRIYSSDDGEIWVSRVTFPGADFQGIAFGNRIFVAIPASGERVAFSRDRGVNWSNEIEIPNPVPLRNIVYGEGIFVAVGPNGVIRWSSASLSVNNAAIEVSSSGASYSRTVNSWDEGRWQAVASHDWIRVSEDSLEGVGTETVTFTVESNPSEPREGCVVINEEVITVRQRAVAGNEKQVDDVFVEQLVDGVLIAWEDLDDETGYRVRRFGGGVVELATLAADEVHFVDRSVTVGDPIYFYEVTPLGLVGGFGRQSEAVDFEGDADQPVAHVVLGDDLLVLAWENNGNSTYPIQLDGVSVGSVPGHSYVLPVPPELDLTDGEVTVTARVCYGVPGTFGSGCWDSFMVGAGASQPGDGVAEMIGEGLYRLRWSPVVQGQGRNREPLQYEVRWRAPGQSSWFAFPILNGPELIVNDSSFESREYQVRAVSFFGAKGPPINFCMIDEAKPVSLASVFMPDSVRVEWAFTDLNFDRYQLQRRVNGTSWSGLADASPTSHEGSFVDDQLVPGNEYRYRVRGFWRGQETDWLESEARRADLAAVQNLRVLENDPDELRLLWESLNGAASYEVQRSFNGTSGWVTIANPTSRSYRDGGLTSGTAYHYRVRGKHQWDNFAPWSEVVSGIPPLSLVIRENYHDKRSFSFTPMGSADEIVLERTLGSSTDWVELDDFQQGKFPEDFRWFASDDESIFFLGEPYRYRVRIEEGRTVTYSEIRQVYPVADPPTNLTATIATSPRRINVSWITSIRGTSYDIERMTVGSGGGFETLATNWTLGSSYGDTNVVPGVVYRYRVLARGDFPAWGPSRYSNTVDAFLPNSIIDWRFTHFGYGQDIGEAANDADPDGDGLVNLVELMFDLDPNSPDPGGFLEIYADAHSKVTVEYTLREDFQTWPVERTLQASEDLFSWEFDVTPIEPAPGTNSTFRHVQPVELVPAFFRLRFVEVDN